MLEFGTHVRDLIDRVNNKKKAWQSNLLREIYLNNENASQSNNMLDKTDV